MMREFWEGVKQGAEKELSRSPFLYGALWVAFILHILFTRS